jgi:hypothetical protein
MYEKVHNFKDTPFVDSVNVTNGHLQQGMNTSSETFYHTNHRTVDFDTFCMVASRLCPYFRYMFRPQNGRQLKTQRITSLRCNPTDY